MPSSARGRLTFLAGLIGAIGGPVAITALLSIFGAATARDYVFIYVALVAVLGTLSGLRPALVGAALSFLLVDYFFVPPLHTLTIADPSDVVDLVVFVAVAGAAGGVGSGRRHAQIEAERLAAELRRTNTEMERLEREQAEAAAVAVRLAQAQQQVRVLEASDRLRTDLLANVSHELRTPLASILTGATDLLGRPHLAAPVRTEVEAIISEARRLERLVSDLLDMARIEAHALTLDAVDIDLGDAVEAAAGRLRLASPGRPVEISLPADGLEVLADWDRLGQILDNLLQNADRHAPAGTPITVAATPGKRSMVVIRVVDRDRGCRWSSGSGSSSASSGGCRMTSRTARPAVRRRVAPAWVWRSSAAWSRPTPAGCGSRIPRRAREPASRSRCRPPLPTEPARARSRPAAVPPAPFRGAGCARTLSRWRRRRARRRWPPAG
jgi:K+-sensing histidine kinase KdpD